MRNQHSYSELQAFKTCGRKWQHRYVSKIKPIESNDSLVIGKACHAGVSSWMLNRDLLDAIKAACLILKDECKDNRRRLDLYQKILPVLEYYLPRMDIEHRYRVMTTAELFNEGDGFVSEYLFDHDGFFGYVDAVLWDSKLEEQVLVDYKFRKTLVPKSKVDIDSQIPFYVAVLNKMGANITKAIMWQFRVGTPTPAKLISKGRALSESSQTTTWSYWVETLPGWFNGNLLEWRKKLEKKLYPDSYFMDKTYLSLKPHLLDTLYKSQMTTVAMMEAVYDFVSDGGKLPGLYSSYGCGSCEYLPVCSAEIHGKDVDKVIQKKFERNES